MSDTPPDLKSVLRKSLELHYSKSLAAAAVELYFLGTEEYKVYIVGCLLLTLSASVQPQFTLLPDRQRSLASQLPGCSTADAIRLAEAGLYPLEGGTKLVCFHCSAKLSCQAALTASGLDSHRAASPNCYYVRFLDFVASRGADARLVDTVPRDVVRYVKALRKLRSDLACPGLQFASSFGYNRAVLDFCATRHFMRNSGRLPDRAGDLIELVHRCETQFDDTVLDKVDVQTLLGSLKLLGVHGSGSGGQAAATAAAAAAAARGESGYHSVVIGRFDQQSGSWSTESQSFTREQVRELEALIAGSPRGGGGGGGGGGGSGRSSSSGGFGGPSG